MRLYPRSRFPSRIRHPRHPVSEESAADIRRQMASMPNQQRYSYLLKDASDLSNDYTSTDARMIYTRPNGYVSAVQYLKSVHKL